MGFIKNHKNRSELFEKIIEIPERKWSDNALLDSGDGPIILYK